MAKPGRKPLKIPTTRWEVRIRADLAAEVELLLADPLKQKPLYGARSELIEELLGDWMAKRKIGALVIVNPSLDQIGLLIQHEVKMEILPSGAVEMPREWAEKLGLLTSEPAKT